MFELVFLDVYQMDRVVVALAFFIVEVPFGETEHVPKDDGLGFEWLARDPEQTVLYLIVDVCVFVNSDAEGG